MRVFHEKLKFYNFKAFLLPIYRKFSQDAAVERPEEYKTIIFDFLTRFDALACRIGDEMAADDEILRDYLILQKMYTNIIDSHYRYCLYPTCLLVLKLQLPNQNYLNNSIYFSFSSGLKDIPITQQSLDKLKISKTNPLVYAQLVYLAHVKYA